mmetsp:Transcript_1075/g.2439  ORF Transcript_1075/g.2439 Transcript_1075/m.2439 type:complete len:250 (+) Transcript_1075:421-1170(+)
MLARRKRWRQEPVQSDNHPAELVGGEATERLHDVALAGGKALKTWLCAGRSGQLQVQTLHGSLAPKVNLAQDLIPPACVSGLFVGFKLAAFSLTEQTVILPRSLETMAVVPVELEKGALTKPIMTLQVFGNRLEVPKPHGLDGPLLGAKEPSRTALLDAWHVDALINVQKCKPVDSHLMCLQDGVVGGDQLACLAVVLLSLADALVEVVLLLAEEEPTGGLRLRPPVVIHAVHSQTCPSHVFAAGVVFQ